MAKKLNDYLERVRKGESAHSYTEASKEEKAQEELETEVPEDMEEPIDEPGENESRGRFDDVNWNEIHRELLQAGIQTIRDVKSLSRWMAEFLEAMLDQNELIQKDPKNIVQFYRYYLQEIRDRKKDIGDEVD